jgi:uncharacterized membrane protein YccC
MRLVHLPLPRFQGSAVAASLLYGLRLWASVSLALLVAYWLELGNPYWAGTSAAIVCQPSLGTTLRKGQFRAVGTFIGAVVIVILVAIFPQSRAGLLISLALWSAICGFFATVLRNFASYAAALAGITAAIVFADVVDDPAGTFDFAVIRATEICIGILAAGLVLTLTDFGDARRRLARGFSDAAKALATGIAGMLTVGFDSPPSRIGRRELVRNVIALDATIDEAIGESSDLRSSSLQAPVEGLFMALSAWRAIGNQLDSLAKDRGSQLAKLFLPHVAVVSGADWFRQPEAVGVACRLARQHVRGMAVPDLDTRVLVDAVDAALQALERVANGVTLLVAPGREQPDWSRKYLHVADYLPAILNAFRVIVALAAAELAWIVTAWPGGQTMITFAAICVILFSAKSEDAYPTTVAFATGTVISVAIAAILNFAVLPALHGFVELSLMLGCVLVPVGALSAGTWRKPVFIGMLAVFISILAPANQPTYDPSTFFNSALAIAVGTIVAAISLRLIPPLPPELRVQRLLALSLRDLRRLATRRHWPSASAWIDLACQRLAALPPQATLEEVAQLVAALSAGEAMIELRNSGVDGPDRVMLERALAHFAMADVVEAHDWFARFCEQQPVGAAMGSLSGLRARATAAVIASILRRHAGFFSTPVTVA